MKYVLTPQAKADIFEIWCWIARDSLDAADSVESAIFANSELIGSQPAIGHPRPDLTKRKVFVWPAKPYEKYLIVYDPLTQPVQIQRVLHGYRRKVWKRI